jgi:serine/threonine protein kinase
VQSAAALQSAAERAALLENTTILEPAPLPKAPPVPPSSLAQPTSSDATRPRLLPEQLLLVDPPPEAVPGSDPSGQWLQGRYELQMLLGRGGMASVYKAIDHDRVRLGLTDNIVALKVVQANASRPASSAALLQEFQSAQRLSHPNVINVFDIDRDGDNTFYSMELLSGARLSQLLRRVDGTVLQRRYALAIIRDIGAAIGHAHTRGVVHADLKPSNVMITQEGEVRVLDFGGSSMPPREPWVSAGDNDDAYHHATPAYASCEQLERKRADPRDDIYALACIAYLLLAGRHPFEYLSSLEARSRGMQARRPAGMPLGQWRALRHGLSWDRASQPADLQAWLTRLGLRAGVDRLPPLADLTAPRGPGAGWVRPATIGAIAVAIGVGTGILLSQSDANWSRQLDAALGSAQGTAQNAWHSLMDTVRKALPAAAPEPVAETAVPPTTSAPAAAEAPAPTVMPAAPSKTPAPTPAIKAAAPPVTAAPMVNAAPTAVTAPVTSAEPPVAFASQSYTVSATDPAARIVVQRNAGATGDLNFVWWTEADTAQPDVDYASLGTHSERLPSGQERMTVYVPIISNPLRHETTQFQVVMTESSSHRGTGSAVKARATVTIEGNR